MMLRDITGGILNVALSLDLISFLKRGDTGHFERKSCHLLRKADPEVGRTFLSRCTCCFKISFAGNCNA